MARQTATPWWEQVLRGQRKGWVADSLRRIARWTSVGYGMGVRGRELAYQGGLLRSRRLAQPTICVGNLTVGGTGKTPLVVRLAQDLMAKGLRPAVLLRGYRREVKSHRPVIVRSPARLLASIRESGDEAMELATRLPGASVGVGADRYAVGKAIASAYPVDCFVLDDGFQHHRLERDINLVTLDVSDPWGGGALLPAGMLRERPDALKRADAVILTRTSSVAPDRLAVLREEVRMLLRPESAILESRHEAVSLVSLADGRERPLASLRGCRVLAVSGIGNPQSFESTLLGLGVQLLAHLQLGDHRGSARRVAEWAAPQLAGADALVMTEKDAMRWGDGLAPALKPFAYIVRMSLTLTAGQSSWNDLVELIRVMAYERTRH